MNKTTAYIMLGITILCALAMYSMVHIMGKTNEITYIVRINEISQLVWEQKQLEEIPLPPNQTWRGTKTLLKNAIKIGIIEEKEIHHLINRSKKQHNLRWTLSTEVSPPQLLTLTQIENLNTPEPAPSALSPEQ
jgi:hypothetical protein